MHRYLIATSKPIRNLIFPYFTLLSIYILQFNFTFNYIYNHIIVLTRANLVTNTFFSSNTNNTWESQHIIRKVDLTFYINYLKCILVKISQTNYIPKCFIHSLSSYVHVGKYILAAICVVKLSVAQNLCTYVNNVTSYHVH